MCVAASCALHFHECLLYQGLLYYFTCLFHKQETEHSSNGITHPWFIDFLYFFLTFHKICPLWSLFTGSNTTLALILFKQEHVEYSSGAMLELRQLHPNVDLHEVCHHNACQSVTLSIFYLFLSIYLYLSLSLHIMLHEVAGHSKLHGINVVLLKR